LHFDHSAPPGEKRQPPEFPKIKPGLGGLKEFITGLEAYFNDHFGCRKSLIRSYRTCRSRLFHDRKGYQSVVIGSDGWFYFTEDQMVEHYRGILSFTPDQLHDWQALLEHQRDWLAQRGIKFLFVVAPDKQSIYPEYLPSWMKKVGPETKLDQFFAYMKAHSTVDVLDLRQTLREARPLAPTYFKTDTHWNQFGAFMAYQRLVKELADQQLLRVEPLPLDAFERTNQLAPPGDMTPFVGVDPLESNAVFFSPKPFAPHLEPITQKLPNHPETKGTRNPNALGSAVLYHDSFGDYWIPFLGYNFGQVYYLHNNRFKSQFMDAKLLEQEKPTVVMVEVLERLFNVANPKELLAEEASKQF
jgi:hypothetical protein